MKFQLSQKAAKNRLQTSSSIQLVTFIKNTKMKIGLGISVPLNVWDKKNQKIKSGNNLRKGAATNTVQIVELLNSAGRWG